VFVDLKSAQNDASEIKNITQENFHLRPFDALVKAYVTFREFNQTVKDKL
jgi:hypothetical protein